MVRKNTPQSEITNTTVHRFLSDSVVSTRTDLLPTMSTVLQLSYIVEIQRRFYIHDEVRLETSSVS